MRNPHFAIRRSARPGNVSSINVIIFNHKTFAREGRERESHLFLPHPLNRNESVGRSALGSRQHGIVVRVIRNFTNVFDVGHFSCWTDNENRT